MQIAVNDNGEVLCGWFALCENVADGYVEHPALGPVPTCERCATRFDLDLVPCKVVLTGQDSS